MNKNLSSDMRDWLLLMVSLLLPRVVYHIALYGVPIQQYFGRRGLIKDGDKCLTMRRALM
jgi:hypothetical protein